MPVFLMTANDKAARQGATVPDDLAARIAQGRAQRIDDMRNGSSEALDRYLGDLLAATRPEDRDILSRVWDFVNSLDYSHPGLSKEGYLVHPLRTVVLLRRFSGEASLPAAALAMCHNLIEVGSRESTAKLREIDAIVPGIHAWVGILTIDRARQSDDRYLQEYYGDIASAPVHVAQVKVSDKMDNLHILCLNPDDAVRAAYLREIEQYVTPLAARAIPAASPFLAALVEIAREIGHQP